MKSVLVVDDKELMRSSVAATLERAGFAVQTAEDGERALAAIAASRPDVIVTDLRMPGMTGVELIERIRAIDEDLPIVMMTAFGTIDTAVRAMRSGAFDYITKPFEGDELVIAVKRAGEHGRVKVENAVLRLQTLDAVVLPFARPEVRSGVDRLLGGSDAMKRLREEVATLAQSSGTVLITGESGVGKEVVARAIHECSPRGQAGSDGCGGAYLAVNCAALSESLLESELFGHERGAFTGAERMRKGRFELADRGTLLLDEISEVSSTIQAKLLRVLQERAFERVGSSTTIGVDVRVVCTSNRDLPASVACGEFRQDLYFRLNVLPIRVPSLRERAEDVAELAKCFVERVALREGRGGVVIEARTLEVMKEYAWPGNVRELQNICERAVVLCGLRGEERIIRHELVEAWLAQPGPAVARAQVQVAESYVDAGQLETVERKAILGALERHSGHRQRTAAALGIGVRTLGLKLKKWKELGLMAA